MKTILSAALAAILFTSATAATAATIEVSHDCDAGTDCNYTIFITGKIEKGDADRFLNLIKRIDRDGLVSLDSPGGVLYDALVIGMTVHERGFLTYVRAKSECASACADIWLAGKVRYISEDAAVGFHATFIEKKGKNIRSKDGDKVSETYYRRLGLPEMAIRYLLTADPNSMTWLSAEKAYEIGIIATSIKPEPEPKKAESKAAQPTCLLDPNRFTFCEQK